ncbi:MAG: hypothetical protein V4662_16635 [Verrucomicrobiota bacterium]
MSAGTASIEERRAADRLRVAEYLKNQRPFTQEEWVAQLRLFDAAGRDTASALPFWKRWLWRRS